MKRDKSCIPDLYNSSFLLSLREVFAKISFLIITHIQKFHIIGIFAIVKNQKLIPGFTTIARSEQYSKHKRLNLF